ncbi:MULTISPECIES: hypothetical protein [unclassified Undibacterium]|uniref:hypothetical protein n=1 Tax=unclassified Undibacterium TaxID=2630295 RepID=UPI002AC99510|nr:MULTISPECIES: hypothetical protein [unclassified Undibacterium]MEB0138001.1 hypothetical protein [Undibacterium sp. CCC2.1]MEB0170666.1 hypothetical protein [Undibacterium sp. CCC1.1]MEB0177007.1 hypothetical protein [Undibacterium sp. CCC3.4]MEB0216295.1 hypothetical protein [Undibacterium sp. 5I2]WPX45708.1 hypothetical protein RHM61_13910 [Undibacterium sp. CCC3.4]
MTTKLLTGMLVLTALLLAMLSLKLNVLQSDLEVEQTKTAQLNSTLASRDSQILQWEQAAAAQRKRLNQLSKEHQRIRATLTERETVIKELHHDNTEIQIWAATPLPAAVASLCQHPDYRGAGDYRPDWSLRQPLPAGRQRAQD